MRLQFVLALVLALGTALGIKWFETHQLKQDLTFASERNQTLSNNLERAKSDMEQLHKTEQERQKDRVALQKKQRELLQLADSRLQTIRNLSNENEELRTWATQPLPGAVVRMYQRPSFQSATDYLEYLRLTNPLHPAGDEPEK